MTKEHKDGMIAFAIGGIGLILILLYWYGGGAAPAPAVSSAPAAAAIGTGGASPYDYNIAPYQGLSDGTATYVSHTLPAFPPDTFNPGSSAGCCDDCGPSNANLNNIGTTAFRALI